MSVQNPERIVTKQDLSDFYGEILPYLGGSAAAGFTPVGTIIAVFAETAPANYLACDGSTYNKADYPVLANHLLSLTNHSAYEVSGDNTKFKVPDLRGEFLRGTGTNSHVNPYLSLNEGSGSDVGEHQYASVMPGIVQYGGKLYYAYDDTDNIMSAYEVYSTKNKYQYIAKDGAAGSQNDRIYMATTRPTNTSVLFCIATKNIIMGEGASIDYSTDERVVGTWIDGSLVWQKTLKIRPTQTYYANSVTSDPLFTDSNIKDMVSISGTICFTYGNYWERAIPYCYIETERFFSFMPRWDSIDKVFTMDVSLKGGSWYQPEELEYTLTLKYTKTT